MIRVLKLTTGEEIVGVIEDKDTSIFVKWPVKLSFTTENDETRPRIKVDLFAGQVRGHSVDIDKSFIIYTGEPTPELKEYYDTNFGKMVPASTSISNEAGV